MCDNAAQKRRENITASARLLATYGVLTQLAVQPRLETRANYWLTVKARGKRLMERPDRTMGKTSRQS